MKPEPKAPTPLATAPPPRRLVLEAEILFRDGPEVEIRHNDDTYRLRRTRGGKLILTK
ncbi:hemin uptake protein HemP [Sediminicoccus sp. KRV36]|uniref:hemin uptake protein HemP n=1 Tax=Sediminicoccus sp. KRV36 TaxID=3133721 RepID=UPI00200FA890|nr:hemin uptake protein HemP [Sediminicoccus rosea]UPY38787.1 hemin uptake protein HemP [Sediminicoccus rosea]